jgi:hypothetical protein
MSDRERAGALPCCRVIDDDIARHICRLPLGHSGPHLCGAITYQGKSVRHICELLMGHSGKHRCRDCGDEYKRVAKKGVRA